MLLKLETEKEMSDHVRLICLECVYCGTEQIQDKPRAADSLGDGTFLLKSEMFQCPNCGERTLTVGGKSTLVGEPLNHHEKSRELKPRPVQGLTNV